MLDGVVQFAFLAITVALAAYLGTLFVRKWEKIGALKVKLTEQGISEADKNKMHADLKRHQDESKLLVAADGFLVILAISVGLRLLLWAWMNPEQEVVHPYYDRALVSSLFVLLLYLGFLHARQWRKAREKGKDRARSSKKATRPVLTPATSTQVTFGEDVELGSARSPGIAPTASSPTS